MSRVLLLLGSNIDRFSNIPEAIRRLSSQPDIQIVAVSDYYESDDVSGKYATFLNAGVQIETDLDAAQLRARLRTIERNMGRVRTDDKFAPRPIDIDISFYSDLVLTLDGTQIPDPDMYRFPHAAVPLADIAPEWRHPQTNDSLAEIAQAVDGQGLIRLSPAAIANG